MGYKALCNFDVKCTVLFFFFTYCLKCPVKSKTGVSLLVHYQCRPERPLTEVERHSGVVVRLTISNEIDLMLPLLLLQAMLGAAMVANAATTQDEDDGPNQPEPPVLIVVAAALRLATAVS